MVSQLRGCYVSSRCGVRWKSLAARGEFFRAAPNQRNDFTSDTTYTAELAEGGGTGDRPVPVLLLLLFGRRLAWDDLGVFSTEPS